MLRLLTLTLLLSSGCCTNLQGPYVTQMEETYEAILLDVKGGFYTPDDKSQATLASWAESNKKARKALEAK